MFGEGLIMLSFNIVDNLLLEFVDVINCVFNLRDVSYVILEEEVWEISWRSTAEREFLVEEGVDIFRFTQ